MRLIAYSSSEGGGMNGSYSSCDIAYTGDGRCRVQISSRAFHNKPTVNTRYYAEGLLEKLSNVCERYNVSSWENQPDRETFMYDATSGSKTFIFEDGTRINLGSGKIYPEQANEMFQELYGLIRESRDYGVDLEITEDSPFAMMSMGMMAGQPAPAKTKEAASPADGGVSRVQSSEGNEPKWAKYCSQCGAKFNENQKFCAECGCIREPLR